MASYRIIPYNLYQSRNKTMDPNDGVNVRGLVRWKVGVHLRAVFSLILWHSLCHCFSSALIVCLHVCVCVWMWRPAFGATLLRMIICSKLSSVLILIQVQGTATKKKKPLRGLCVLCYCVCSGEGCLKAGRCLWPNWFSVSCWGFHRWLHLSWSAGLLWELGGSSFQSVESAGYQMDLCAWFFNIYICVCVCMHARDTKLFIFVYLSFHLISNTQLAAGVCSAAWMLCDFIIWIKHPAEFKGTGEKINSPVVTLQKPVAGY